MELEHDCTRAKDVCSQIKNEGARFFWLKLGEAIAAGGRIPHLIPDEAQDEDGK